MIVWLWDAPGPACTTRGVTGSEARARQAAEALLTGGQATSVVLESAELGIGVCGMTFGYLRTRRASQARLIAGRVTWTRAAPQRAAS
jgi:hypothetical protein